MAEHVIGKSDEFPDGQMKQVEVGGVKLLIVNQGGEFSALGGVCPHQGATLAEGLLHGDHVRCPWHQACFCARTGEVDQPPALDSLNRFDVRVEDGQVIVSVPDGAGLHRTPEMASYDPQADGRTFVIVGAGAAGGAAAEAIRQEGFEGRLVMITREDVGPYDRTELSKYYLSKDQAPDVRLRSPEFYEEHDIEIMAGCEVTALDADARKVTLSDGRSLSYDASLLATGARARRLPIEGMDLQNVFTLRGLSDAAAIREAADGAGSVVVVGASFIGTEVASSLTADGRRVTVVAPNAVPLAGVLGEDVGRALQGLHEAKGTLFKLGQKPARFEGNGSVEAVLLESGERIKADAVVVGIGVMPVTDYLKGVQTNEDGSVTVDGCMRAADGLWAAGDIARFPDPRTGEPIRIEHWRLALQLGRTAGRSMAGREDPYDDVPLFWTDQAGITLVYVGHTRDWDETIVDGDVASGEGFLVHYVSGGRIVAACAVWRDAEMAAIAELMRAGAMPDPEQIRAGGVDLVERARQAE